jgi:serine/threonine protein kinase
MMALSENLTGHTLAGNYFLNEKKGSGQISDVYRAWDKKRTAEVAVKVLRQDQSGDRNIKGYFSSEAKLMAALDHPHIVRFYEFRDEGRVAFFVMDWVEGIDLKAALQARGEPYELDEIKVILKPISSALNYAHGQKIIHCDIKPANILMETSGKVLLTDFGIARHASQQNAGGTPPYMAPEQFENGRLTPQTDVYALGVTLFELLSGGEVPFRGENFNKSGRTPTTLRERIHWEVMNLPYPGLNQFNPDLPDSVDAILQKALEKNPFQRYASTLELNQAFEELGAVRPPSSQPSSSVYTTRAEPSIPERPPTPFPRPDDPSKAIPIFRHLPADYRGVYLTCLAGEYFGCLLLLRHNHITIGRSSQNLLVLKDRSVSRKHASIQITRQGAVIRDAGSTLGTFVNGRKVEGVRLTPGDTIQIGHADQFEFHVK